MIRITIFYFFPPSSARNKMKQRVGRRAGVGYSQRQGRTQRENYLDKEREKNRKKNLIKSKVTSRGTHFFASFRENPCFSPVISDARLTEIQTFQVCDQFPLTGRRSRVIYFNHISARLRGREKRRGRVVSIPQQLQVQS